MKSVIDEDLVAYTHWFGKLIRQFSKSTRYASDVLSYVDVDASILFHLASQKFPDLKIADSDSKLVVS